jgi:KDO2-lipid IV(A) lauroyltransferase
LHPALKIAGTARYMIVESSIRLIRTLPYPAALAFGRALGMAMWAALPLRRRLVEIQAGSALGLEDTGPLALEVFKNQGGILVDAIRYAFMDDTEIRSRIRVQGMEHFEAAMRAGKGVMMITGHIGNWEILSNLPRILGIQFCVMADERRDARLEAIIDGIRSRCGATILPPRGKALMLVRELRKGRTIGMVVDQRGRRKDNLFCDFFGMPAPTNPAPAFIAIKGDAVVLPVHAFRDKGGYVVRFDRCVEARAFGGTGDGIQALSDFMQSWVCRVVRLDPGRWFWLHSRWVKRRAFREFLSSGGDFRSFVLERNKAIDNPGGRKAWA